MLTKAKFSLHSSYQAYEHALFSPIFIFCLLDSKFLQLPGCYGLIVCALAWYQLEFAKTKPNKHTKKKKEKRNKHTNNFFRKHLNLSGHNFVDTVIIVIINQYPTIKH